MLPGLLSFDCPACGARLQVPPAMAGACGPCPQCRTLIQAPAVVRQSAPHRLPAPVSGEPAAPAAPAVQRLPAPPRQAPARTAPAVAATAQRTSVVVAPRAAACPRPVVTPPHSSHSSGRDAPRPGPRTGAEGSHARRQRRNRILGYAIPLLFLLACAGLFLGTVYLLRPDPVVRRQDFPISASLGQTSSSGLWPLEIDSKLPFDPARGPRKEPTQPTAAVPLEAATTPPVDSQDDEQAGLAIEVPPAHWATEVLEVFLAADSLAERQPLILTNRTSQELAATSLAGPLPQPAIPFLERQTPAPEELLVEFFFRVSFPDAPEPHPKTVTLLVRQRGRDEPPKVVVDPFIDLFDGGLAEFGAAPLEGSRTFHVLAEPIPICDAIAVPESDKKITLRLRPHETAKELANAYVNKRSSVGEMLDQPRSSLRWGQAVPCVVTLHWNQDVPGQPFLELVRLDALTWNR